MPEAISSDLTSALTAFASRETILIALDFDGTLAPLVDDPEDSRMIAPARAALEKLTALSGVSVAIVTGRAIDSVKRVADPLKEWFLVGSHGIEVLSPGDVTSYETPWLVSVDLTEAFDAVVKAHPGTRLEHKPFGLALHTRGVEQPVAQDAESAAHEVCDAWGGDLVVRTGHGIVECSIQEATKGDGIDEVRQRLRPSAVLFAGDDRTDEDGFAVLEAHDVGIRVGGGETIAPYRLADASAVAEALWFIHDQRASVESGPEL
ncbi:MAG: trehalose-phosphatase [Pontimonas sp.]|nr:trehalose-phosphatase [Pontimonas sp.]